ncbi:hypothetical protein ACIPC2_07115 [Curtobacterium pusillum]|uniref:hypothetical protein n=1 Tax=Curtobacterium pusillum TaxID=69373 RepID=UPI003812D88A
MHAFRKQIASDVTRDGLAIELVDTDGERVVEVFRHDDEGGVLTFNSFGEVSIPFDVIVDFVNDAIRAFATPKPHRP